MNHSFSDLCEQLAERLAASPPNELGSKGLKRAAVLVPLVTAGGKLVLPLMRRADGDGPHSSQISFPGGRMEPGDRDLVDTALRETSEEFGIEPSRVEILGRMDDELTVTGYVVTVVVGRIPDPVIFRPDPKEVSEIFLVPVDFFLDERNEIEKESIEYEGRTYRLFEYRFEGRLIWGLTARIIHELIDQIRLIRKNRGSGGRRSSGRTRAETEGNANAGVGQGTGEPATRS